MGNRANVVFASLDEKEISPTVYLHWQGGIESIFAFMKEMKRRQVRGDQNYEAARFIHIVGDFFDQESITTLSLGVVDAPKAITPEEIIKIQSDLGDNGVYVIYRDPETYDVVKVRRFKLDYRDGGEREVVQEVPIDQVAKEWKKACYHCYNRKTKNNNTMADNFEKITKGHYLNSLSTLSLKDVYNIRQMAEWSIYIDSVHNLLENPLEFETQSKEFYRKFESLNSAISTYRDNVMKSKWEPWIKLTIAVGLKAIEIWINPMDPSQKLLTTIGSGILTNGITSFLMQLTITASNRKDNADLDVSLDFMRGPTDNGKDTWDLIINNLESAPGFEKVKREFFKGLDANQSIPLAHSN